MKQEIKKIIIILDGLSDRPMKKLGNKSPLEIAKTPNLDRLAGMGRVGLMHPVKGIAPESGFSQFLILGNKEGDFPGRGPLEALGAGLNLKKGAVYLRTNLAGFRGKKLTDIRIPIKNISKVQLKKINKISDDIKFYPTIRYRGVLEVKNGSTEISNTHPGYKRIGNHSRAVDLKRSKLKCYGYNLPSQKTADKINNFVDRFERITGKTLLLRGAGKKPAVKKRKGTLKWNMIGDMPVERGLAKIMGMKILKRAKDEIGQIIQSKKSVYVQIKGPDSFGHRGDYVGKIKSIEKIDRMLKPFTRTRNLKNTLLCITSDHSTPCTLKRHSSDPVPLLIAGRWDMPTQTGKIKKFSEKTCRHGALEEIEGKDLIKLLS